MAQIKRFISKLLQSNMYVLEEDGHVILIDPYEDISLYDSSYSYDYILLTHEHYDHISGVNGWKNLTSAKLLCSENCAKGITDPAINFSRYFDVFAEIQTFAPNACRQPVDEYRCEADQTFCSSYEFEWMGHIINMIELPGHSVGSIGIFFDHTTFFPGDTLFKDREAECRFPGGSKEEYEESKSFLRTINGDVTVYPGHFEMFSMQEVMDNGLL